MTAEQADAFAQLRTLAAPGRLRIRPDTEGWPVIPGRLGQIECHDGRDLAVLTDRPRRHAKVWAIPGVRRHQTSDRAMRALFPSEALELVAWVSRARRRPVRVMTPARLASLATVRQKARAACTRATSRPQDRTEARALELETSAGPGAVV